MYRILSKTKFLKPHKSTEGKIEWEFNNVSLFVYFTNSSTRSCRKKIISKFY